MNDLLSRIPHPGLPDALSALDVADPVSALRESMSQPLCGFSISGSGDHQSITGYGVIGSGRTREEAVAEWIAGARAVLMKEAA